MNPGIKISTRGSLYRYTSNVLISVMISVLTLLSGCETKERFYRPDMPQKLCAVGIFDVDDTIIYDVLYTYLYYLGVYKDTLVYNRYISFEKSVQFEYPEEVDDSLRDFSFSISNGTEDMFVYQSPQPAKSLELILPERLNFESGRRYFLHAGEKETHEINAETEVPPRPPELCLLSIKTEIQRYFDPLPNACWQSEVNDPEWSFYARNIEIEFSFPNDIPNSYYAVLLIGSDVDSTYNPPPGYDFVLQNCSNFLDFTVLETNTDGFFYTFQGRKTIHQFCQGSAPYPLELTNYRFDPTLAYYIDGSKIPGQNCKLKIFTQESNGVTTPGHPKTYTIRLVSMPKELYLFEKSLYTYKKVSDDPFAEPVNLNGNIKGGNGIFAICRSRDMLVHQPISIK